MVLTRHHLSNEINSRVNKLCQSDNVLSPGLGAGKPGPKGIVDVTNSLGEHTLGAKVLPTKSLAIQREVLEKSVGGTPWGSEACRLWRGRHEVHIVGCFLSEGISGRPKGRHTGALGLLFLPRNLP